MGGTLRAAAPAQLLKSSKLGPGERRPVLGTLALSAASALKLGLQVAVLPILARILGPSTFGLVALAMPLILLANMISDAGLGNALVREREPSPALESTVFWMSLAQSLVLAALVSGAARPLSAVMSAPELAPVIVTLSGILPLSGALSVVNARISRERKFGLFAVVETIASIGSSGVAIGAAFLGAGAWSLVLQQFVLWGAKAILLTRASGFAPLLICKPSLALPFLGFGLNSVGANLADFASKNFSTLLIGGLIGVEAAGKYSMAYQILRVPELVISGPLYLSMFVSATRWGNDRDIAHVSALRGFRGLVTLLAPLFFGLAVVSDRAVQVLLGPAWAQTGPILMWLAPAGFFLCVYAVMGAMLLGLGRSDRQFKLIALHGSLMVIGAVIGSTRGAVGVAQGVSLATGLAAPAYIVTFARQLQIPPAQLIREALSPVLAAGLMAAAVFLFDMKLAHTSPLLRLLALIVSGLLAFAVALAALSWDRLQQDLQWIFGSYTKHGETVALSQEPSP